MASKKFNIASLGRALEDEEITNIDFNSKNSLLDPDIILTFPMQNLIPVGSTRYRQSNLPKFMIPQDFQTQLEFWNRTMNNALQQGRMVICFLPGLENYYLATSAGSSIQNQITSMIPYSKILKMQDAEGKETMNIAPKELKKDLDSIKPFLEYKVTLDREAGIPLLSTRDNEEIVGLLKRVGQGLIIFLPELKDLSTETIKCVKSFAMNISSTMNVDKKTSAPEWAEEEIYKLAEETRITNSIQELEKQQISIQNQITESQEKLAKTVEIKALLYETGDYLENAVTQALEVLSLKSKSFRKDSLEIDHVITISNNTILIGESEGTETTAVNDKKVNQLYTNLAGYQAEKNLSYKPKGILFGNAKRNTKPDQREITFTKSCLEKAPNLNILLINTVDLYIAVQHILDSNDKKYIKECIDAILKAPGGMFSFPEVK
jgi:hypothetical protein